MNRFRLFPFLCLLLITTTACSPGIPAHEPKQELLLNAQYIDDDRILCLYDSMTKPNQILDLYDTNSHRTQTIELPENLGRVLPTGIVKGDQHIYVFEGYAVASIHPETLQVEDIFSVDGLSFSDAPLSKDGDLLFRTEEGLAVAPIQDPNASVLIQKNEDTVFYHWGKWSPDGKKTACFRGVDGKSLDSLCIQTIETGEEIVVPLDMETNNYLWSHQSDAIVLAGARSNGPLTLFLFDANTGELKKEVNLIEAGLPEPNSIAVLDCYESDVLIQMFCGDLGDEQSPLLFYHLDQDRWEYLTPEEYYSTNASFSLDGKEVAVCHQNSPEQLEIFPLP